ncbi:hypothetical protein ABN238_13625 [Providencia rettgeri]|uniref:hypothetical protein n=1 Tax=Providencia rettgeri TaxID=587 RepID=UPI0032DA9C6D
MLMLALKPLNVPTSQLPNFPTSQLPNFPTSFFFLLLTTRLIYLMLFLFVGVISHEYNYRQWQLTMQSSE